MKQGEYLFAYDFDLTAYDTFEENPGIYDVPTAVNLTTHDMFGELGLAALIRQGGLKNRASGELVHDLLHDPEANQQALLSVALGFMTDAKDQLDEVVPTGKGAAVPFGEVVDQEEIAEIWARQKLNYMMGQIGVLLEDGQKWPRPTKGFVDHWNFGTQLRKDGHNITRAVVSSGHEQFIQKSFAKHELEMPDIIVSEDDIRGQAELKNRAVVKPEIFPLGLAARRWRNLSGIPGADMGRYLIREHSDRIVYFGDDPLKDGLMAEKAGVLFGNFDSKMPTRPMTPGKLEFNNWMVIDGLILANRAALATGQAVHKIFGHG
jgi:hypothetical protein